MKKFLLLAVVSLVLISKISSAYAERPENCPYLKCVSCDQELFIDAISNKEPINPATDVFSCGSTVLKNLDKRELYIKNVSTGKTKIKVFEIIKDVSLEKIFEDFHENLKYYTRQQIDSCCQKYHKWLSVKGCTLFSFESKTDYHNEDYITYINNKGCSVGNFQLSKIFKGNDVILHASYHHRIILINQ